MNLFWRESKGDRPVFGVLQKYFFISLKPGGPRGRQAFWFHKARFRSFNTRKIM